MLNLQFKYMFRTFFALCLLVLFFSCGSPKELILLQDQKPDRQEEQQLVKAVKIQEAQYRLQPKDRLQLNVFSLTDEKVNFLKEPQFEVVIDTSGKVELPVMGIVPVTGLTIKEAEEKIKKVATEFLRSPSVTIKLLNFNVTVIGEVQSQGTFNVVDPRINILEAIGQAGGLTENANRGNVRIIRNESNSVKIYRINMLEDNSLSSENYFLQPNDVVIVDPLKAKGTRQERIATIGLVISVISSVSYGLYQLFNNN
jgi:polysaccharide export outer membrane protein